MAGDWIKVEHTMPDKPEVGQIAARLAIDHDAAVGKLVRFWIWADQQCVNGNGLSVTKTALDRVTLCAGFTDALLAVGWLRAQGNHFIVPNFDRHNGQTAKARALTVRRVQGRPTPKCNGPTVTQALPEIETEIEKEKNTPPGPPPRGGRRRRRSCETLPEMVARISEEQRCPK